MSWKVEPSFELSEGFELREDVQFVFLMFGEEVVALKSLLRVKGEKKRMWCEFIQAWSEAGLTTGTFLFIFYPVMAVLSLVILGLVEKSDRTT